MSEPTPREVFERYLEAIQHRDYDVMRSVAHPEVTDTYPQSGEHTTGIENLISIMSGYPGGVESLGRERLIGGEPAFVRTPVFTVVRVEGTGNTMTGISRARYPDGSLWWILNIGEIRDGLVYRIESFWAPYFEPAEWRAPFVEVRPRPEGPRPG